MAAPISRATEVGTPQRPVVLNESPAAQANVAANRSQTHSPSQKPAAPQGEASVTGDTKDVAPPPSQKAEPVEERSDRSSEEQVRVSNTSLAREYCHVVVDEAIAAKLAEEKRRALALKAEIETKLAELKAATAEQKEWLRLRKAFQDRATDNLVDVYALMDAEAAAQRLIGVSDDVSAAILLKLPPKVTSAILAEMQTEAAGRLTAYLAGSADVTARKVSSPAPAAEPTRAQP
ncbi:MAG: hypothetical protein R3D51_07795 [Hyphomicrobiaceae bacterium]